MVSHAQTGSDPRPQASTDKPADTDIPSAARNFNTRLGLILFVVYLLLYMGFVLLNAFAADTMETVVLAGLNLAIVYGFALILVAIVLAFLYGIACKSEPTGTGDQQ